MSNIARIIQTGLYTYLSFLFLSYHLHSGNKAVVCVCLPSCPVSRPYHWPTITLYNQLFDTNCQRQDLSYLRITWYHFTGEKTEIKVKRLSFSHAMRASNLGPLGIWVGRDIRVTTSWVFAMSKHCAKCFTGVDSHTFNTDPQKRFSDHLPSQTGNLRLRKVKWLAQGHTVRKWALEPGDLAWDFNY